jgi:fructokinase
MHAESSVTRILIVGEVLWDQFPDARRLGGAPLNVAVHLHRSGHQARLFSAVGTDRLGEEAMAAIVARGLDTTLVRSTVLFATGRATVDLGPGDRTSFTIDRPAAYDSLDVSEATLRQIVHWNPAWVYYGTLFPSCPQARAVLNQLLAALPNASRFYDANLRPGFESPELVHQLLQAADVVKLNERELQFVHEHLHLPADPEGFCRAGCERYTWRAASVTLGDAGCAMLLGGEYVRAPALRVDVADPVGAGDAFAAAFLHGIMSNWPAARVAQFANSVGAQVVGTRGALPDDVSDVGHDVGALGRG